MAFSDCTAAKVKSSWPGAVVRSRHPTAHSLPSTRPPAARLACSHWPLPLLRPGGSSFSLYTVDAPPDSPRDSPPEMSPGLPSAAAEVRHCPLPYTPLALVRGTSVNGGGGISACSPLGHIPRDM